MRVRMTEKQSRHLDLILRKLLEPNTNALSVELVNEQLFPDESYEYCLELYYILRSYHQDLLYPETNFEPDNFWATEYVKAFLNSGGFTSIYNEEYERRKAELEKNELELEKLKFDVKNSKRIFKTYWWTFSFAIIALILSILNLMKGCASK